MKSRTATACSLLLLLATGCDGTGQSSQRSAPETRVVTSGPTVTADTVIADIQTLSEACKGSNSEGQIERKAACDHLERIAISASAHAPEEESESLIEQVRTELQDPVYLCNGGHGAGGMSSDDACKLVEKQKAELVSLLKEIDNGAIYKGE